MMHDQADELRQLVRARSAAGHERGPVVPLIVVCGGKGNVGATTIAANLTVALARRGRRAVFVDADLEHGGNAHFGQQRERGSVVDVLAGRRGARDVLQRGPAGIQVLSGAWPAGESDHYSSAAHDRLIHELKNLSPHGEVIVVDAGSSRNPCMRRLWQAADLVLMVTTTEPASVMECYAAIKVLTPSDERPPIHTLVNLAADAAVAIGVQARIAEACRRFLGLRAVAAAHVERCDSTASTEGTLIYPARSPSARALDRLADTLWAQLHLDAWGPSVARRQAAA
jgi:flagellar biosynthesis protein FlhG